MGDRGSTFGHPALEVMLDDEGSAALGWVNDGVLYARLAGGLSSGLGTRFATRLQTLTERTPSLKYFADASALRHYDLIARSAFVRVVLARRRKFTALVVLTGAETVSSASKSFAAAIGDPAEILTDAGDFESRLLRAAPFAKRIIESGAAAQAARPPRP